MHCTRCRNTAVLDAYVGRATQIWSLEINLLGVCSEVFLSDVRVSIDKLPSSGNGNPIFGSHNRILNLTAR